MSPSRSLAQSTIPASLFFGVFALFVGLLCAVSPIGGALLVAAAAGGLIVLVAPWPWVIILELVLATLISGSVEYFVGISQANWIPYLLAMLLCLRALVERKTSREIEDGAYRAPSRPWFFLPLILYFLTIIASVGINLSPLAQFLVGIKNYLFMFGIFFAFLVIRPFGTTAAATWKAVTVVACLQLPVVLYQKFIIAPGLSNKGGAAGVSWDAISGTFGGGVLGGHSAAMALFIIMTIMGSLIAWRDGKMRLSRLQLILLLTLPSIAFAEVKAAVAWLLVAGIFVFFRQIRSRPFLSLTGMALLATVSVGIIIGYNTMYFGEGRMPGGDMGAYEKQLEYFFDPDKLSSRTGELGRIASIVFWWNQHDLSDPVRMILGHGLGASRGTSSFAVGEVARQYGLLVDTSALSALLWDVGLLGAMSFVGILFFGFIEGLRLIRKKNMPHGFQAGVEWATIGLFLMLSGLIYNRDVIDTASVQFLMFFFLAILAHAKAYTVPKLKG